MKCYFVVPFLALLMTACSGSNNDKNQEHLLNIEDQLKKLTVEVVRLQEQVSTLSGGQGEPQKNTIDLQLTSNKTRIGSADSEYAIVEYMDYQCPYCLRHAKTTLPQLKRKYIDTGLVQYVVKDFPLDFHAQAESAAVAARCAAEQNKFDIMHGLLIDNSKALAATLYAELASKAGLDLSKFDRCFNDRDVYAALKADMLAASRLGITGTPRFLIGKVSGDSLVNVVSISGAQSIESFEQALQTVFNR